MATPQEALREMLAEREHRKAIMRSSNWIAAEEGGSREYIPVSSTPLDTAYQRSKSVTRSDYLGRLETKTQELRSQADKHAPAADFVSSRPGRKPAVWGNAPDTVGGMVLGFDGRSDSTSNTAYGSFGVIPTERIDLLERVEKMRDSTLDGSHRASQQETHFLTIWDPYDSKHTQRSASFASARMLREQHHRHVRSQYHPHEKYVLPPSVQSDIGWQLTPEKYKQACAKFQPGAEWHGRTASHITQFAQRLQLGARHHLSGPMTKPALHY